MILYSVDIIQGSTGLSTTNNFDNANDTREFVNLHKSNYTAAIKVYSYKHKDFVYWKNELQDSFNVTGEDNMLFHRDFDLRRR